MGLQPKSLLIGFFIGASLTGMASHLATVSAPTAPCCQYVKPGMPVVVPLTAQPDKTQTFVDNISKAIASNPRIRPFAARQLTKVINGPDCLKKRLILRSLESHARTHVAHVTGATIEAIDWAKVDWNAFLDVILRLISLVLLVI